MLVEAGGRETEAGWSVPLQIPGLPVRMNTFLGVSRGTWTPPKKSGNVAPGVRSRFGVKMPSPELANSWLNTRK